MRKLESVTDLLEALKEERGWTSDYRIAKELGIPQTTLSNWRCGNRAPGEAHALAIGEALKISPLMVLAISAVERSEDKAARKAWSAVVAQLERMGMPGLTAFAIGSAAYAVAEGSQCILRQIDGASIPSDSDA